MESRTTGTSYKGLLVVLLIFFAPFSMECPSECHCYKHEINCRDADLKKVPKGIPLSATEINLSDNPQLHIERDYFLNFPKLHTLLLKNVSQREPLSLPNSLRTFVFGFNEIAVDSLEKMFRNRVHQLTRLDLERNYIDLTKVFKVLPKGIKHLQLSANMLASLKQDDLKCCRNLIEFKCEYCSIKFVEPNAFDNSKKLINIMLSHNEIAYLPKRLFEHQTRFMTLDFSSNKIEYFNASELHLRHVESLQLGSNKIRSVTLEGAAVSNIALERNKIERISADMIGNHFLITQLQLEYNRIKEISQTAFQRVKFIRALTLQGNKIESLPGKLFHNTYVNMLFLHRNSISNIDPFIHGMRKTPSLLTLFSNNKLKHLNLSTFKRMHERSRIFISCNSLNSINMSSNIKASIKCSPSADLSFPTSYRFLKHEGYQCTWQDKHMQYLCHACPVGFYIHSNDIYCQPCPPGSFYQDEVESVRCKSCPKGQYVPPSRSPGKDASDCQTCPDGTKTDSLAGTRACSCLKGFHRRYRFGPCEKCSHNGFACLRDYPQLKRGFWMTWHGTGLANRTCKHDFQAFIYNLETYNNDYDRNTMHFNCELPIPIKCPRPDSCIGGIDSNCSSGYTGVLCGTCRKGYSSFFNRCVKCPHPCVVILKFIACLTMFILLCLVVSDKVETTQRMESGQLSDVTINRKFADIITSSLKILISFYQTLVGIIFIYSIISWPKNLLRMFSVFEYIRFEFIRLSSLRCINSELSMDSVEEFWLVLITSLTFTILCFLYYLANLCCLHFRAPDSIDFHRRRNLCAIKCTKVVSLFLYISYPLIITTIIHILPVSCESKCTAKSKGVCLHTISYLRSDYSLACPTMHTRKYTLIAAYCSLIIPVGLPFVLWNIIRRSLHHQNRIEIPIINNPSLLKPPVFIHALRFTYENYVEKYWYWETVEMVRKLTMTAGAALFLYHTKIGLSSLIIVGMGFAILHAIHKPMKDGFENVLQMISLVVIPLNLSVGALIQSDKGQSNQATRSGPESWKLGIFLIVANSLTVVLVLIRLAKLAVQKIIHRLT